MGFLSCRPHRADYSNDALNQLIHSAFTGWPSASTSQGSGPALDIHEEEEHYLISVDLPGIDKKNVDIQLTDDLLTISGSREGKTVSKEGGKVYRERFSGNFVRRVRLPEDVNTQNMKASFKDGVLSLTLGKREDAKPKNVKIDIE